MLDSQTLLQHPGPAARLEGHVRRVQGGLGAADAAAAEAVLGTAAPTPSTPLDGLKMDEEWLAGGWWRMVEDGGRWWKCSKFDFY